MLIFRLLNLVRPINNLCRLAADRLANLMYAQIPEIAFVVLELFLQLHK